MSGLHLWYALPVGLLSVVQSQQKHHRLVDDNGTLMDILNP